MEIQFEMESAWPVASCNNLAIGFCFGARSFNPAAAKSRWIPLNPAESRGIPWPLEEEEEEGGGKFKAGRSPLVPTLAFTLAGNFLVTYN